MIDVQARGAPGSTHHALVALAKAMSGSECVDDMEGQTSGELRPTIHCISCGDQRPRSECLAADEEEPSGGSDGCSKPSSSGRQSGRGSASTSPEAAASLSEKKRANISAMLSGRS